MMTREELKKKLLVLRIMAVKGSIDVTDRFQEELIDAIIPTSDHVPGTRPTKDGWFEFWNHEYERWEAVEVLPSDTKFHDFITVNDEVLIVERTNPKHWGREIMMPTGRPEE